MKIIKQKINLKNIDKTALFKSAETGNIYLDCTLLLNDEPDQYGNHGMIVQDIGKERREAGEKGTILGNVKIFEQKSAALKEDDLPF